MTATHPDVGESASKEGISHGDRQCEIVAIGSELLLGQIVDTTGLEAQRLAKSASICLQDHRR
jgi:hypothetical protein